MNVLDWVPLSGPTLLQGKMTEYLALLDVVLKYSQGSIRVEFLDVCDPMIYLQNIITFNLFI